MKKKIDDSGSSVHSSIESDSNESVWREILNVKAKEPTERPIK